MYHYRAMMKAGGSLALVVIGAAVASAQPKPSVPPLVHASEVIKLAPSAGFVDDAIGGDDSRIAWVDSDAAARCELHVVRLDGSKAEIVADILPVTTHAIAVTLVGADTAFVVGETEDGHQVGALIALAKKPPSIVYKLGPATHVSLVDKRVVLHRTTTSKDGTSHTVEVYALDSGRRVAAGRALELDAKQTSKALEFRVNHWAKGMTLAIGVKGGEWDKKENQRSPDTEATYDLVANKFVDSKPITDLFEQRKRFQALADGHGELSFARMSWDNTAVQLWRDGKPTALELDQALASYDPKSLQGAVAADGAARIALAVDPVNPDAVARKKADPAYFDVFAVERGGSKAKLIARVLAPKPGFRFGTLGARFWLLERSPSSERGGKTLTVYQLAEP